MFLELQQSYYIIGINDFISGKIDEFLSQVKFLKGHYVRFDLPEISTNEIIDRLFNEADIKRAERVFCSSDKTRIIYIYRNKHGTYSVGNEKMVIADEEERSYTQKYGWREPVGGNGMASFYGTPEDALNDLKTELTGFTEKKENRKKRCCY